MVGSRRLFASHLGRVQQQYAIRVFCFTNKNTDSFIVSSARIEQSMANIMGTGTDRDEYPHAHESQPELIFSITDKYKPRKGDVCIVDKTEGYEVVGLSYENAHTIKAECTRMFATQVEKYTIPEFY